MIRLPLAEAQERARPHLEALPLCMRTIDWSDPDREADNYLTVAAGWPQCREPLLAVVAVLRAHARHIDFEAGAAAERANAAGVLRRNAAKYDRRKANALSDGDEIRFAAKESVLREAANWIERGDRAETP